MDPSDAHPMEEKGQAERMCDSAATNVSAASHAGTQPDGGEVQAKGNGVVKPGAEQASEGRMVPMTDCLCPSTASLGLPWRHARAPGLIAVRQTGSSWPTSLLLQRKYASTIFADWPMVW